MTNFLSAGLKTTLPYRNRVNFSLFNVFNFYVGYTVTGTTKYYRKYAHIQVIVSWILLFLIKTESIVIFVPMEIKIQGK